MSSEAQLSEAAMLRALRAELSRIAHDLANPLAIVSGNLQVLSELGAMEGVSSGLADSIQDALRAVDRFEAPMSGLSELRERIDARLERLAEDDS